MWYYTYIILEDRLVIGITIWYDSDVAKTEF